MASDDRHCEHNLPTSTMNNNRIPTVKDLRVKLCYICREEEHFDAEPENPPREWTHPCNCTLVAHEACLLQWIQTSQADSSRAPNALKCPQCGSEYELESHRPRILKLLGNGNQILQKVGRTFTLIGAAGCVAVVSSGFYIIFTGYGAWALQQFIGKEMFDVLLTDDPANWPWTAFLNLPILTISLILSRFQATEQIPALIPLLLVWPPSSPVGARARLLDEYWTRPANARSLTLASIPSNRSWPPSPTVFGLFIVPIARAVYKRCFAKLQYWALGAHPPSARASRGFAFHVNEGGQFMIRIRANIGENAPEQAAPPAQEPAEVQPGAPEDPNAAAVAAAEQLIEINTSSLGRRIGGALLIPVISSAMGTLLFRLSKQSQLLKTFLGVRPPLNGLLPGVGPLTSYKNWEELGTAKQVGLAVRLLLNASWNGTRTWAEADPVWWRNSIGLGLFIAAKDCLQLLHLWLAKRELESRHVKNRDFSGVDIRELDLVPSFPRSL